jgi:transposase
VLGIDDWAWRKGQRYGTIVCDLERHCVVDLLPDRQSQTVTEWLRAHAPPEIISRDRAGAYAEASRLGAPHAIQVADRFHLLRNLREAVERVLTRHGPLIEEAFCPPSSKHNFHRLAATQPRASTGAIHPLPTSGRVASARRFQKGHCLATRTEPQNRTWLVACWTVS